MVHFVEGPDYTGRTDPLSLRSQAPRCGRCVGTESCCLLLGQNSVTSDGILGVPHSCWFHTISISASATNFRVSPLLPFFYILTLSTKSTEYNSLHPHYIPIIFPYPHYIPHYITFYHHENCDGLPLFQTPRARSNKLCHRLAMPKARRQMQRPRLVAVNGFQGKAPREQELQGTLDFMGNPKKTKKNQQR